MKVQGILLKPLKIELNVFANRKLVLPHFW